MADNSNNWRPDRLSDLIEKSNMSLDAISKTSGLSISQIRNYANGTTIPSLDNIVIIADTFGVLVDFLIGRTSETDTQKILNEFPQNFELLKKLSYEKYLMAKKDHYVSSCDLKEYEAPWPYNLFDVINSDFSEKRPIDWIITDEDMKKLKYILNQFPEKYKDMILMHFKDNISFRAIGKKYNITGSRVAQLINYNIARLRHPAYKNYVLNKDHSFDYLNKLKKELDNLKEELDDYKTSLDIYKANLDAQKTAMFNSTNDAQKKKEIIKIFPKSTLIDENDNITCLRLSVRPFNALMIAHITKISELIVLLSTDEGKDHLKTLRNLGVKSYCEIIDKISEYTGLSYKY